MGFVESIMQCVNGRDHFVGSIGEALRLFGGMSCVQLGIGSIEGQSCQPFNLSGVSS
jgi:hypothetical protein